MIVIIEEEVRKIRFAPAPPQPAAHPQLPPRNPSRLARAPRGTILGSLGVSTPHHYE